MNNDKGVLAWVHFGDLHIGESDDENYSDFLDLIGAANRNLAGSVDFAFLPGDNADDGTDSQFKLVQDALLCLKIPAHIIPGDHDRKAGTLDVFRHYLEPSLYRAIALGEFRLLFLNALDADDEKTFDFGPQQLQWLETELIYARATGLRPLVFVHLYPSELKTAGKKFARLIREYGVELVEMGHTHYNELANDGQAIYAATRSTGQIEEGPPGFSVTVIDHDVISWKFKQRGPWPFVMITSPADQRLLTRPESPGHLVRGRVNIRVKAWDARGIDSVNWTLDGQPARSLTETDNGFWEGTWDSREAEDGSHAIRVEAAAGSDRTTDEISILVSQSGVLSPRSVDPIDYCNAVAAWPEKGILGTQLGPNENGTKGPWPSWREK